MKIVVTTDGGARPNPGKMYVGGFLRTECGTPVAYFHESVGLGTNNEAEYLAAFIGVKKAVEAGAQEIELHVDSQLFAKQWAGIYAIRKKRLRKIRRSINDLLINNKVQMTVVWGKRDKGDRPIADALSRDDIGKALASINAKYPGDEGSGLTVHEYVQETLDILQFGTGEDDEIIFE